METVWMVMVVNSAEVVLHNISHACFVYMYAYIFKKKTVSDECCAYKVN